MKILVVDDSALVYERVAELLPAPPGMEIVGHAMTAEEGLRCRRERAPDLVILDIQLPDGSGMDVLHQIKAESPGTRVITLTNYLEAQYRRRALQAGAHLFLDKSGDFHRLPEALCALQRHPPEWEAAIRAGPAA